MRDGAGGGSPEVDDALFTRPGEGGRPGKFSKITADGAELGEHVPPHTCWLPSSGKPKAIPTPDLILTGTQAIDDLDGLVAPMVAEELGLPYRES